MTPNPNATETLWTGDCLDVLSRMDDGSIDLIYLDPPFNTGKKWKAPPGSKSDGAEFNDNWREHVPAGKRVLGMPALAKYIELAREIHTDAQGNYLNYMAERLIEMRRVLKDTGSLYLHCDPKASHYLKHLLDAIFGWGRFRCSIAWKCHKIAGYATLGKKWTRQHNEIIYYVKTADFKWNRQSRPPDPETIRNHSKTDDEGRRYFSTATKPKYRRYLDDLLKNGVGIGTFWEDISSMQVAGYSKEAREFRYPTQKPLALLERIIRASSNEGDVVLDPFCGSGTTCVAAWKLSRRWIGMDVSSRACEIALERLKGTANMLFKGQIVNASELTRKENA